MVTLKNAGTTAQTLSTVTLSWPQSTNGKLQYIKLGSNTIFSTSIGSPATITALTSTLALRVIAPGATVQIMFDFERSVSTTKTNYSGSLLFGTACQVSLP
jgi:hypothetical protein